jgi:outer membrane lipoprotein-sorting protein
MRESSMTRMSKRWLGCGVALVWAACGTVLEAAAIKVERDTAEPATTVKAPPTQAAAAPAAPQLPKLSALQIAERNVQARGGLAAWRAIQSIQISGLLDAGGTNNARLPYTLQMKRPHYQRVAIEFQGQTALQVYDGQNGWKLRPFLNRNDVEPFSDEEKQRLAHQDDLEGPLIDYAAKGSTLELEGTEMVEGKANYRLKLTMADGYVRRIWVDGATFLESKMEGNPRRLDGKMRRVENYLRDYRKVKDVLIPFVSESKVETALQTHKMTVDKVVLNPQLEDRLFGTPVPPAGPVPTQAGADVTVATPPAPAAASQ